MRRKLAALGLVAGLLMLAGAGALGVSAREAQRREQEARDRAWSEMASRLTRHVPPVLPPARPGPVPVRGLYPALALMLAGGALVGASATVLFTPPVGRGSRAIQQPRPGGGS